MCTMVRAEKDECIRLVSATGGGYGDPKARHIELIEQDIRDGFLSRQRAKEVFAYA